MEKRAKAPLSGDRPQAAAEQREDRARTVAQPLPWTAARASYASISRRLRVQMPAAHGHGRLFAPHPLASAVPHLPAYVPAHVLALQHAFVTLLHTPLGHDPQVTVDPHVSSNVPHANAA